MKKTCFILSLAGVAALAACSTQELESPANLQNGMLMVRPIMPEVDIETKADLPTIYAFIPEELNAGTVNPVLPKINSGNTYYYNLEGVGSDVVFSNQDLSSAVSPRYDENGFSLVKTDQYSADLGNELLFGVATGIQTGNTEPYEVRLNRFSSSVQFKFMAYDTDGNELPAETFQYADATLGGFATELRFGSDITTSAPAPYGNTSIAESAALQDGQWLSTPRNVIPGTEQMDYDVNITLSDGTSGNFKGSLGRTLEANHSYIITFRMKKANGSASFILEEPEVYENDYTLYPSEQKMFRVKSSYAVGKDEGSTVSFHVSTEMPYGWSYELMEGSEYFTVTRDNDELTVTALSTNEAESRTGLIMLRTTEGHEQPVYISQMNSSRQVIYLTKHDNQRTEFTITGSNIEIDYGGGFIPYDDGGNIQLSSDKFANGTTATITADWVSSFIQIDGYKYSYQFENCVTLTELTANIYDGSFDFSNLPALKTLVLDDSDLTEIIFSEGQGIENLSLRNGKFTALNLNNIANSLKKLDCDYNRSLSSLEIYPSDFTGELIIESLSIQWTNLAGINCSGYTHLEDLNISNCPMETVNLNGCTALKELEFRNNDATYLNISNCTSLKVLTFDGTSLNTIARTGSDMIETINIGLAHITDFDFSNMTSLKQIAISNTIVCNYFNISNCPNVKIINKNTGGGTVLSGEGIGGMDVDISNCTSLDYIRFNALKSWKVDNTPNIKRLDILRSGAEVYSYDFSKHPNVEVIQLYGLGVSSDDTEPEFNLDLSGCPALKTLYIDGVPLTSLALPQSVEKIELRGWQDWVTYPTELNLSGYPNLKNVTVSGDGHCLQFNSINFSDCTALETCSISSCFYTENSSINLSGCNMLQDCDIYNNQGLSSINFSGCWSPMDLRIENNQALTSVDLSNTGVTKSNIKNNKALTSVTMQGCTALETCEFTGHEVLMSIDVSYCTSLKTFDGGNGSNPIIETVNVSGCSSLEHFSTAGSRLTGMDFSSCQKLLDVNVRNNLMETDNLNTMFNSLVDRSRMTITGEIHVSGNPGAEGCDRNIALDKNWYFPAE